MTDRLRVDLTGAPQTMLATFYAKALDADFPDPILGDRYSREIVDRFEYDIMSRLRMLRYMAQYHRYAF